MCLTALDPIGQGHSATFRVLKKRQTFFPTVLTEDEEDDYRQYPHQPAVFTTDFFSRHFMTLHNRGALR